MKTSLAMLFAVVLAALPASALADLYIVVNADNSIDALSVDQVERIFMLKTRRFENDVNIEPLAQPEGSRARDIFNSKVLKRNEQQLKYYWSRKMFSGGDRPPPIASGDSEIIEIIADKPGGIGYMLKPPKNEKVKVVLTIKN